MKSVNLTYDLPCYVLQRQAWVREMEEQGHDEDLAKMEFMTYFMLLGIVCTFCLLAWVLW